jgi:S-adenosylmethionine synthetase
MGRKLFTSESVTAGHPDKISDQISDAVLDAYIGEDPMSRVACETLSSTNFVLITGEINSLASPEIEKIAREKIREIGYDRDGLGFHYQHIALLRFMKEQSPELSAIVEQKGASCDQGLMFGYATNEIESFMPLPISLANMLTSRLDVLRKSGEMPYLRPDGKSQVTVEYEGDRPSRLHTVLIATQHDPDIDLEEVREGVRNKVIIPVCDWLMDEETTLYVNFAGPFTIGGPMVGTGYTGKKLAVDTYGGVARHGGGAMSGKDCTKMDRTGIYLARFLAKNVVAAGFAQRCEVQLSYGAGFAEPISVNVDTFGTGRYPVKDIVEEIRKRMPLDINSTIERLNLRRPIYSQTTLYGHLGKEGLPWEQTDLFG